MTDEIHTIDIESATDLALIGSDAAIQHDGESFAIHNEVYCFIRSEVFLKPQSVKAFFESCVTFVFENCCCFKIVGGSRAWFSNWCFNFLSSLPRPSGLYAEPIQIFQDSKSHQ